MSLTKKKPAGTEHRGRPGLPERDLVVVHLPMPRAVRSRLLEGAREETRRNPLGQSVSARALGVRLLSEGLDRLFAGYERQRTAAAAID